MDEPSQNPITEQDKAHIDQLLELVKEQYAGYPLANEINQEYEKLIDCRHEIIITVNARVVEQDESGNPIGTKEICKQNYHIPVPAKKDYHVYMSGFFTKLQQCIMTSDKEATNEAKDTTNE